jgi:hypothetical protein
MVVCFKKCYPWLGPDTRFRRGIPLSTKHSNRFGKVPTSPASVSLKTSGPGRHNRIGTKLKMRYNHFNQTYVFEQTSGLYDCNNAIISCFVPVYHE